MSSDNITQNTTKSKSKYKKCNECDRYKKYFNEIHQICCLCYEIIIPSGNGKMVFVPYDKFKDVEFVAEGGFSEIYKATWIDGLIAN
ncbi:uncharacterized protein OCT59_009374 [Rhizophagus irregularis]|uniref:uncharacterized protein n=1 Tax=Rhizophagus irregularis TaxID=588596 RepID=UPI000CC66EF6|nr:hypothetical protein OCT59_009374 [Rhizophagus irregularis]